MTVVTSIEVELGTFEGKLEDCAPPASRIGDWGFGFWGLGSRTYGLRSRGSKPKPCVPTGFGAVGPKQRRGHGVGRQFACKLLVRKHPAFKDRVRVILATTLFQ